MLVASRLLRGVIGKNLWCRDLRAVSPNQRKWFLPHSGEAPGVVLVYRSKLPYNLDVFASFTSALAAPSR